MGLPAARYLWPRFWVAVAFSLPILILAMGHLRGSARWASPRVVDWVQFVCATPVFFWSGAPFLRRWWDSIRQRDANMFTLIVTGTGAAYLYSAAVVLSGAAYPLYFEAAAVTTAIVPPRPDPRAARRVPGTDAAVRALLDLAPPVAHRLGQAWEEDVPLSAVIPGRPPSGCDPAKKCPWTAAYDRWASSYVDEAAC